MADTMPELDVAMAFLCQVDRYHFQLRTKTDTIGAVGKIGCFGGQIYEEEEPADAVSREVAEETNINAPPEKYGLLGPVKVVSDRDGEEVVIKAKVFKLLLPLGTEVIAKQGELATFRIDEIADHLDDLTPATRAAVEEWL